MQIDDGELSRIVTTGKVVFQSQLGDIRVRSFVQARELTQAPNAEIEIITISSKTVYFLQFESVFHTLTVTSAGGIEMEQNVKTTNGDLTMSFASSNYINRFRLTVTHC